MQVLINEIVEIQYKEEIEKVLKKVLRQHKKKDAIVSITFVDDRYMKDLNKKHSFKDISTDVLSFSLNEKNLLGDVFISVPFAQKNAKRYNCSLLAEIKRLAVHGLLHLLGYKHKTVREKEEMQKIEKKILEKR